MCIGRLAGERHVRGCSSPFEALDFGLAHSKAFSPLPVNNNKSAGSVRAGLSSVQRRNAGMTSVCASDFVLFGAKSANRMLPTVIAIPGAPLPLQAHLAR
jgi:hypothetical protein